MILFRKYYISSISVLVLGLFYLFIPIGHAQAASLYFSPSTVSRPVNQSFSVTVRVNTEGQAINAVQGSIVFDSQKAEVTSISKSGSIFNLWTQEPTYSNTDGTIEFEGGLPSPGYSGAAGSIITISFKTKTATTVNGYTDINLVSGAILANDGQGTNILTNLGKLSLTVTPINGSSAPATTPSASGTTTTSATVTAGLPDVSSSTHTDQTKWYSNNSPAFSWEVPSGVSAVSYLITDKASSNPGPNSDGLNNHVSFSGISDGTHYLHVKFKRNGVWGPIAHFKFNIDTTAPEDFNIEAANLSDNAQPSITFETTDKLSGIEHYEIKVGGSDWVSLAPSNAGQPYQINANQSGTVTVLVKAIDGAGNVKTESKNIAVTTRTGNYSAVGGKIAKLFDWIINLLSKYGLLIALIVALFGLAIMATKLLSSSFSSAWKRIHALRSLRKAERRSDVVINRIVKDMKEELKLLKIIDHRRHMSPEEKYLKSKLERYIKDLQDVDKE